MKSRSPLTAVCVALTFSASAMAYPSDPCNVIENSKPNSFAVQYSLVDNTTLANPIDFVGFVVNDPPGVTVGTTNAGWIAQSLTITDWTQPMGGITGNDTWEQVTGKAFTDVFFPNDPCVGYFLSYTITRSGLGGIGQFNYANNAVIPGETLAGFLRSGSPESTFLAFGVPDSTNFFANPDADPVPGFQTFTGPVSGVPEPAAISALGLTMLCVRRSTRR